jgi:hypothetical protein
MTVTTPTFEFGGLFTKFFCGESESWTMSVWYTPNPQSTTTEDPILPVTEIYTIGTTRTVTEVVTPAVSPSDDDTTVSVPLTPTTPLPSTSGGDVSPGASDEPGPTSIVSPSATTTLTPTPTPTGKSHTAAIAGGVGGGVGGALVIAGIIWCLVRRKINHRVPPVPEIAS